MLNGEGDQHPLHRAARDQHTHIWTPDPHSQQPNPVRLVEVCRNTIGVPRGSSFMCVSLSLGPRSYAPFKRPWAPSRWAVVCWNLDILRSPRADNIHQCGREKPTKTARSSPANRITGREHESAATAARNGENNPPWFPAYSHRIYLLVRGLFTIASPVVRVGFYKNSIRLSLGLNRNIGQRREADFNTLVKIPSAWKERSGKRGAFGLSLGRHGLELQR